MSCALYSRGAFPCRTLGLDCSRQGPSLENRALPETQQQRSVQNHEEEEEEGKRKRKNADAHGARSL